MFLTNGSSVHGRGRIFVWLLLCHGLKGVVKPIRSLTRKRGQKLLCIIHLEMYDNLEVSAAAV